MLMQGKKGIIMGVANKFSIAYGIAERLHANGAKLAFTAQNEYFKDKMSPIAEAFGSDIISICDVSKDGEVERAFSEIKEKLGDIDFIVHSIAFSDKNELRGEYCNTSRENFLNTMNTSCYSFTDVCKNAKTIMPNGGSIIALTYYGSQKVFPNYNVMAIAKSALETSVMYLASDLGKLNIRVNAVSSGPIKTLASSGVGEFSTILNWNKQIAPLRRNLTLEDVANPSMFLLSDLASGITGEVMYVDCGANIMGGMKVGED